MTSTPAPKPQTPGDELAGKLMRTEVQHEPSSIPGREIVQVLTEIPCGIESGWHIHPGEEVGYIVAGTVEMMIKDRATLTLPNSHADAEGLYVIAEYAPVERLRARYCQLPPVVPANEPTLSSPGTCFNVTCRLTWSP